MIKDMVIWGRSVGLSGLDAKDISISVSQFCKGVGCWCKQSAERAVRTLKEGCNTLCASLESVGIEPYGVGIVYIMCAGA